MRLILVLRAYLMLIYFDYYLARGNFAALYDKVRSYPVGKKLSSLEAVERDLRGCGPSLHLVLEGGALPAAVRRYHVSAETQCGTGSAGDWCPADTFQGSRVG